MLLRSFVRLTSATIVVAVMLLFAVPILTRLRPAGSLPGDERRYQREDEGLQGHAA
jgi:hypothetical protein